ncbi:MAG: hypothetical protein U0T32_07335 [Chitinophagales bacterium]
MAIFVFALIGYGGYPTTQTVVIPDITNNQVQVITVARHWGYG